ncbi:BrnT family toxin [Novosphingobium colocasiae]|uniref:BrnT family toxin n=1 Tax=Novosphingobium colocasiae TaxID=1256513 RepID=A0A918PAY3_9SPHN|nr:BrnT family toxin [Novosphingobium colocasiae]GGY94641.1 hypothetical protein GCM10011614_07140 [Novosphingobium colocasiae]
MEFTFDPAKDEANRFKHGLRLAFGMRVFEDPYHELVPSFRPSDGEDRYKAIGLVDRKLITTVYVIQGSLIRTRSPLPFRGEGWERGDGATSPPLYSG